MPDNLLQTGVAGLGGGVVSAILVWIGFKSRLDTAENALKEKVSKGVCDANIIGLRAAIALQNELLTEVRRDLKELVKEIKK